MKRKNNKVLSFEESRRVSTATGFRGYRTNCKICGLSGPTKRTEQANCLNISLEAEMRMR